MSLLPRALLQMNAFSFSVCGPRLEAADSSCTGTTLPAPVSTIAASTSCAKLMPRPFTACSICPRVAGR